VRKFLHIAINFSRSESSVDDIQPVLNKAVDWVRYAPNCWVVLTTSDLIVWYQRLKGVLHDNDTFFVTELAILDSQVSCTGFLPAFIWQWFAKHGPSVTQLPTLPSPSDNV
jgi:hypothetical protein